MKQYIVIIGGIQTIVEADSSAEARQIAIDDYIGTVTVREATDEEKAWQYAMSGKTGSGRDIGCC